LFGALQKLCLRVARRKVGIRLGEERDIAMAKLLFLQNLQYEFLGPMYIASAAKRRGHECSLAIGNTLEDFAPAIESFKPDIVGFSIMTGSHRWGVDVAKKVKAKYNLPNIFGGAHPTFFPKFLNEPGVDMVIKGEGEHATCDLLDAISSGKPIEDIQNLGFKKNGFGRINDLRRLPGDLDDYSFPDRDLYQPLNGKVDRSVQNVLTSRGCPFHCAFCFEDAMREMYKDKGKYVRLRQISKVIEECQELKAKMNPRSIYFADDLFGMDKHWLYEFMEAFKKKVDLRFVCLVRADIVASDPMYARRLADGGCDNVFFGIESGNEELRNKVLVKKTTDDQIYAAAKLLHDAGIKFRTYNIMGLPGETLADAFKTVQININIKTDFPWCSIFSPIPGVALTDYAIEGGYLDADFNTSDINQSFFLDNTLKLPNKREIQNLQKFFQTAVQFPWLFPVIKRVIKLPPNFLFSLWFGFMYFVNYIRSEKKSFAVTLKFAIKNWRHVLLKQ
jgi:radical SAM superfamily enzyme YgiQ (UPF0313 family)